MAVSDTYNKKRIFRCIFGLIPFYRGQDEAIEGKIHVMLPLLHMTPGRREKCKIGNAGSY